MTTLKKELDAMHTHYVEAVNFAIAEGDTARAHALATAYDDEAIALMAEREGLTHLLPIRRPKTADSRLRRLVRRLTADRAA